MTRRGIIRLAYSNQVEARPFSRFTRVESEQKANEAWAERADSWGEKNFNEYGYQISQLDTK
jgi:hypothetical protein